MRLLKISSSVAGGAVLISGAIYWVVAGSLAAVSAVAGGALVIVFFGISLLAGHFMARRNPSGAVGLMAGLYFVKVIVFGAVFLILGAPSWLDGKSFVIGAVVSVVAWQLAEIYGFSKARLPLYNEPSDSPHAVTADDSDTSQDGRS